MNKRKIGIILIIYWLNYSFGPSICCEISVRSSSFSFSQFGLHFLKVNITCQFMVFLNFLNLF